MVNRNVIVITIRHGAVSLQGFVDYLLPRLGVMVGVLFTCLVVQVVLWLTIGSSHWVTGLVSWLMSLLTGVVIALVWVLRRVEKQIRPPPIPGRGERSTPDYQTPEAVEQP